MNDNYGTLSTEQTAEGQGEEDDRRLDDLLQATAPPRPTLSRLHPHHRRGLSYDQRPPSFRRSRPPRLASSRRGNDNLQRQQQHRRHRTTSLSEFLVQQAATEWTTVSQTLVEELEDYDGGHKTYNMDMALVRSLSVLPDDLMDLAHETVYMGRQPLTEEDEDEIVEPLLTRPGTISETTTVSTDKEQEQAAVTPANVLTGVILLVIAVLAVSSNGTALHLLFHVPAALKLFWRMTATTVLLTAFLAKAALWNKVNVIPNLTVAQWTAFGLAVVLFSAHCLLLYLALEYTTIGNAVIYANSQALLLIVGKLFVGRGVTRLEGIGVVVAFTGALLCSHDSERQTAADAESTTTDDDDGVTRARWGDALALLSAVAGVLYLTLAKTVRSYVPVTVFVWMVMGCGCLLVLAYLYVTGVPVTWDRHPHTGLFGWMITTDHHVWILLHIAVVGNVLGTMGFVRAMAYFSTTTIAVATLMEPLLAQLIGYVFHVGLLPGPLGYVGNGLVMLGTIAVVWQSAEKADGGDNGGGH